MNWGLEDAIAAIVLIGGAALAATLIWRSRFSRPRRWLALAALLILLALVWAELAVGLFS